MAQHFLLSAQARTLSLKAIYQAGEEEAYAAFCRLRWPETNGSPQCRGRSRFCSSPVSSSRSTLNANKSIS